MNLNSYNHIQNPAKTLKFIFKKFQAKKIINLSSQQQSTPYIYSKIYLTDAHNY